MGGQNHQPTKNLTLIAPSAWLSQKVGEGFSLVLEANNVLETAIILGMAKLNMGPFAQAVEGSPEAALSSVTAKLQQSWDKLGDIAAAYDHLLEACRTDGYLGNPHAHQLDSFRLEARMSGILIQPAVNREAWSELYTRIKRDNILVTLAWEREQFLELLAPTEQLIRVIEHCASVAHSHGAARMVEAIEHNEIPLRQYYARVFSRWNHMHAVFLYSALIMTELFYATYEYPSLLETSEQTAEASAVG
jgi:hypothetical protein